MRTFQERRPTCFTSFNFTAARVGHIEHMFDFMTAAAVPPENIIAFGFMGLGGETPPPSAMMRSDLRRF